MAGNGGIIGPVNTVTNGCAACGTAPGVWQMNTVYNFVKNSDWVYNFATQDYMVVGGGGGSGGNYFHIQGGGGGGAGGYRASGYGPSPLQGTAITSKYGTFAVTVGGGGTKGFMASAGPTPGPGVASTPGGNSIFNPGGVECTSMITATGGGGGAQPSTQGSPGSAAQPGGSGGGGGGSGGAAGTGNAGGYCKSEGSAGGTGGTGCMTGSGSGGGATGAGSSSPSAGINPSAPSRGAGAPNAITGAAITYATGGSFTSRNPGGALVPACAGADNTGDGGDSQGVGPSPANPGIGANYDGLAGGKGVVIVRSTTALTTDSACAPVRYSGTDYVATFNASANLIVGGTNPSIGLDYLVVAGGGGSANDYGAGGGAGGYRTSFPGGTKVFLKTGPNAITVGGGGAAAACGANVSVSGTDSQAGYIFTSGGGYGGMQNGPGRSGVQAGGSGGSGGGGALVPPGCAANGGTGNVVTTSPVQGYNGGRGTFSPGNGASGGGGGAGEVGAAGTSSGSGNGGRGGAGLPNSITGSAVSYAGGGGGAGEDAAGAASPCGTGGAGGTPGGTTTGTAGTINRGGGAGGGSSGAGALGGSGIVILRIATACKPGSFAVAPGTNTTAVDGSCTVATFTVSGTLTL